MQPNDEISPPHEPSPHPAPAVSRYASVTGLRLHYLDYGSAGKSPMLCVHGGAAHAHWYDFVAGGFTSDHHVRALDLRGHGDSDWGDPHVYNYQRYADDLFEFVDRIELRDFVLIGHSMGGMVVLLYAAMHPGRVKKLIVVDTALNLSPERVQSMRNVGQREGRAYASQEEFQTRFKIYPSQSTASREVLTHIARHSGRQFPDHMWRHKVDRSVQARRVSLNGVPLWQHIEVPALLVKGGLSERITPEVVANIRRYCPQVQVAEVPAADHHVTLDNPQGFVRAVSAFLRSTGSGDGCCASERASIRQSRRLASWEATAGRDEEGLRG